ncbi:MAG: hypothetical protein ACYTEW_21490 [Planctomycetota bacterium]
MARIAEQRRKDHDGIYIHTTDKWHKPGIAGIFFEAVEWYCDLLNPIETTPAHLLADPDTGEIDMSIVAHSDTLPCEVKISEYRKRFGSQVPRTRCAHCGKPVEGNWAGDATEMDANIRRAKKKKEKR